MSLYTSITVFTSKDTAFRTLAICHLPKEDLRLAAELRLNVRTSSDTIYVTSEKNVGAPSYVFIELLIRIFRLSATNDRCKWY